MAADLTDAKSLEAAFDGVAQVFLYATLEGVHGVIGAARAAGVRKIVLLSSGSVIHPTSAGNAITEEHRKVEEAFEVATELWVVPIRPLVLATNALGWSYSIKAASRVALYKPDAMTAPIHEKDIAAVVVAALTGDDPAVSDLLTGPRRLTQREQVSAIAAATGTSIEVNELSREDAMAQFARFMPAEEAEAVLLFLDDAAAGNSPSTDTVQMLTDRAPAGFDGWARDHAADFS